jgi:hypothetical protein
MVLQTSWVLKTAAQALTFLSELCHSLGSSLMRPSSQAFSAWDRVSQVAVAAVAVVEAKRLIV